MQSIRRRQQASPEQSKECLCLPVSCATKLPMSDFIQGESSTSDSSAVFFDVPSLSFSSRLPSLLAVEVPALSSFTSSPAAPTSTDSVCNDSDTSINADHKANASWFLMHFCFKCLSSIHMHHSHKV